MASRARAWRWRLRRSHEARAPRACPAGRSRFGVGERPGVGPAGGHAHTGAVPRGVRAGGRAWGSERATRRFQGRGVRIRAGGLFSFVTGRGTGRSAFLLFGLLLGLPLPLWGEEVPVRFEHVQRTRWGESVYLLGDAPQLGGGDLARARRMVPGANGRWELTVSLPAGLRYRHSFWVRSNDPDRLADPSNGVLAGAERSDVVPGAAVPRSHRLRYTSGWAAPRLRYLFAPGEARDVFFRRIGPGRAPGEWRWEAEASTLLGELAFLPHDGTGSVDRPPDGGFYRTRAVSSELEDGRLRAASTAPGRGRVVRVDGWWSRHTGNARSIFIYLPPGYDRDGRRYPVLYMHDGQNLFGPDALFGGWRVGETCDRLIAEGAIEPFIVVGVANTPSRMQEYVPEADGGEASHYARFLREELKPWIDRSLRTRPGARDTGVCGSSLGGLVSLYLAWEHPDTFGRVASLSGSFWLRGWVQALERSPARPRLRIWLDSGSAGASHDSLEDTFYVRDLLLRKGYVLAGSLEHEVDHGAGHSEPYWRARLGRVFRFLFPPR
ncbi:MAG: hypothetical protein D6731_23410 [Planctomycetota bacterium]|nr:MAG: hypothetical protein D6731_23410 [Planctomycetota bacterium]